MIVRYLRNLLNKFNQLMYPEPSRYLADRYPQYQIGRGTYGDLSVLSWGEDTTLIIGNYTSIAKGVKVFLGGEHRIDWVTTYPFNILWEEFAHISGHPKTRGDVVIGNDVWIGTDALILSGVTIGDGAVVGARAVVARNVPPYAVVVGIPAKVVKYRFSDVIVERLLRTGWWNWSLEEIRRAMPDILNTNIEEFLDKAESKRYAKSEIFEVYK